MYCLHGNFIVLSSKYTNRVNKVSTNHQTVQSDSASDFQVFLSKYAPNNIDKSHRNDP